MIKQAPRPFQIFAMVAFVMACVGVLLYLWLSFGGVVPLRSEGYRFQVRFPEATQLAEQADVRISGVPVGKVIKIDTGPNNTTEATLEMRSRYAPVASNARAMLRQKSLLGETYVDITTGDDSRGSIPDGGLLPRSAVAPTVELDEIFRTFDDDTQQAFQTWMQSQAASVNGRGTDINATFGNFPEFVEASDDILTELHAQSRAVSGTIRGTGEFFSAISERDGQLAHLITESNRLFQTTAARNRQFAAIWEELPDFSRQSRLTLPRLTEFANRADPVVQQLQPAATEFAGTFKQLDRLSPEFEGFFRGLGPLITKSRRGVPALESLMRDFPPLLADFEPFLRNFNPLLAHLGQNRREISSFFGNVTATTTGRNPQLNPRISDVDPIHFLRASSSLSPQGLAYYPRALGQTRSNPYMAPGGLDRLASGLLSFETRTCANGDPAPPAQTGSPELVELAQLAEQYAFRTTGGDRNVARPPCVGQGAYPGFSTQFPQLEPEP
ncbi:MAG TPA: MlaD family protein [Thermoleophilaceae bacterium]|nr:MlaD family protein [Thermoleophilaceae bacterium]